MPKLHPTILIFLAASLVVDFFLRQRAVVDQPRVEVKSALAEQQAALVQQTQTSGGDLGAAMTKFQAEHAAELAAQAAAEAGRMDVPSVEREALRERAGKRVQRIREIQAELKAGKDPADIVPPAE